MMRKTTISGQRRGSLIGLCAIIAMGFALVAIPGSAVADESAETPAGWESWLDNEYFKVNLNVRARIELADFDGLDSSQAYTVRTRLGIGTKPFYGFSFYAEGENIFAINDDEYFDVVETPTGQAPIADPENTELNQLFARYQNKDALGLDLKVGRQRVILDDHRFVGNVGWRQNEQTYDVGLITVSPVEHLSATYGYLWDIHRIFGDQGPAGLRDLDSQSHVVHFAYDGIEGMTIAAFAYLLDVDDAPGISSDSYGFRVTGKRALDGPLSLNYAGSYAIQTDAASNPVNYTAHYVAAEGGLTHADVGSLAVGYELLSSDDGKARFVTPLATAHKFNGWADVFLNNGGVNGLQDLYVSIGPKLPWGLKGKLVYHHFWSHEDTNSLGDEVDILLKKPINDHVTLLTKAAYFDGTSKGPVDRWRYWLEVTFTY
ncbi:MAG: alginate export family protein [Deltaproteobacteria bacterium]|nr:alginate export family protein [Deltaproteobacteria bacterium]MBW2393446.1 alginate export family protein [Deltaproteobacteria bacterium]